MAASDGITGISLNGVRKLLEDKSLPEEFLETFEMISGAAIALAPLVAGPAGIALWPLLEPKDALVGAAKTAIKKLAKSRPRDYVDQARRFAAANTMLALTAYLDTLDMCRPDFIRVLDLGEGDLRRIAEQSAARSVEAWLPADSAVASHTEMSDLLLNATVSVPHPAMAGEQSHTEFLSGLYTEIGRRIRRSILSELTRDQSNDLWAILTSRVPALAVDVYQAEFLGMAIDYQPFLVWSMLQDQEAKDALLRRLGDELRAAGEDSQLRFELLGAAIHRIDLGLDRLSRAMAAQPLPSPEGPRHPGSAAARAAEALRRRYAADAGQPVIDDRYDPPAAGPRLRYPGNAAAYVPQAYRQVRYAVGETHLERDEEWANRPAADDLGPAITRYLESPYGAQSPLLVLGQPGSGKSLLTKVYAARLEYPRYTVIRVELRDADPAVSIQKQVEDQIRKDTGYDVNWADLADNLPLSPPIIILDGYDELLQVTGKLFTDYLDQVQRFQRDALIQDRPVRVIVTSRITLIDKAIIPPGTTVIRLEPFDEPRRTEWISRWNDCNAAYFRQADVSPFTLPVNEKLLELAEQPLLLLMLAIFDSAGNALSERSDLDQTLLYDELLRRFIERELGKGERGVAFSGLPPHERRPLVDRELARLGVAAIGMFNRQEVKILRDQLDRDLAYFGAQRPVSSDLYGQSQSELLLGSFFFIHESRSRLTADGTANVVQPSAARAGTAQGAGRTAFEFLHNTFGEFLAADFILRHVIDNAAAIRDLTGNPTLEHVRQQHLSTVTPYWFASLLYTPLHTRPNILALLREWSFRRLPANPADRANLLAALDEILHAQLRALLAGVGPLDLSARALAATSGEGAPTPPPYDPLPVLGHAAVYSLNLFLVRTYLADQTYALDERALDLGDRPWERLTALWRSWFTPEILSALSLQFTASRASEQLIFTPARSGLTVNGNGPLAFDFNASVALADNLTASSTGLHLVSMMTPPPLEAYFTSLLDLVSGDGAELAQIADLMRRRLYSHGSTELPADIHEALTTIGTKLSGTALALAELAGRIPLTPRQRDNRPFIVTSVSEMLLLSRYESALFTDVSCEFDAAWLPRMLRYEKNSGKNQPGYSLDRESWNRFLRCPAAAPVLRAAIRQLSLADCAEVIGGSAEILSAGRIAVFDVDSAAAFAVLAWRGADEGLCGAAIDTIVGGCGHGGWSLLDIPLEIWDGLADLFVSAGPDFAARRENFAAVLDEQLEAMIGQVEARGAGQDWWSDVRILEFCVQALRIGALRHRRNFLENGMQNVMSNSFYAKTQSRRCFLLLARWARENGEAGFLVGALSSGERQGKVRWAEYFGAAEGLGPDAIDFDRAAADLTYREAMDLRWVLDLWRHSGPSGGDGASRGGIR